MAVPNGIEGRIRIRWQLIIVLSIALGLGAGCAESSGHRPPIASGPVVASVTPSVGIVGGGTEVHVEATGFSTSFGAAFPTVEFGGQAAAFVAALSTSSVAVIAPPAASAGPVDIVVISGDLTESATLAAGFTYTAGPIVASVSPDTGDVAGGDLVSIVGDNFATIGPVTVTFGAADATGVNVQGPSVLTCFTPAGPVGPVTVTVTNPDAQQGSLVDGFTYRTAPPDPVVTSVSPSVGDPAGGEVVTIHGLYFDMVGPVTVTFGGLAATGVTVADPTTLTCITPAAPPGPADVRVTNPGGAYGVLVGGFTFTAGPVVTSVVPGSGDPAGGDLVTVAGDNFATAGTVTVTFGAAAATAVNVADPTTLTCITPPGSPGPVTVMVTNPDARQGSLADGFVYTLGPIVIGVSPATGDKAGGNVVTVTGDHFDTVGAVTVTFGVTGATGVNVVDPTTLTCVTPPGPQGPVTVTVTNPDARQGSLTDGFTYTAAPTVTAVSPDSGHPAGGDLVTIVGADFDTTGTVTVTFGAAGAAGVTVLGPSTITCLTPAGSPGPVTVTVTNPGGRPGSLVDGFRYTPDPTVTAVTPSSGSELGGDVVMIMGSDFATVGTVTVTFGAADATGVTVIGASTISCVTPPGPVGPVTVTVRNPNGQQGSLVNGYTYVAAPPPPPTVSGVTPSAGSPAGGETVTVTGSDFATVGIVTVTFGAVDATGVIVMDPSTILCLTPPGPAGPVTVTVTNPDLQQGWLVDGFTYTGADPAVIAMEDRVYALINQERANVGKPPLTHDPDIRLVARAHSEDMRDRNFFDHVNPDGDDPPDRLTAAGIPFTAWGETIHWNLGAADPAQVAVDWWMNSPPHKQILLDETSVGYTLTGVGCATDGAGRWWFTVVVIRP